MNRPVPPSPENLRQLYEALPSFVEQQEEKREARGEKRVSKALPKKLCDICGRGYDFSYLVLKDSVPEMDGHCPRCDGFLKEGCLALVAGNNFAFTEPITRGPVDLAGTVQKISVESMGEIQRRLKIKWETQEKNPPASE